MADDHDKLWNILFSRYDTDGNGRMDAVEFSFLLKDLMNIRDNVDNHSFEDASALAQMFRTQLGLEESFSLSVLSDLIKSGAFLTAGVDITMFHILAETGSTQMMRTSSNDSAIEVLNIETVLRRTVSASLNREPSDDQVSASSDPANFCRVCQVDFPPIELYGVGLPCQKKCLCDVKMCLRCLRTWVRLEIRKGARPTCPGSTTANKRCGESLDTTLVALLFRNECPLCEKKVKSTNAGISVTLVPCAFGHSFCQPCLETRAMALLTNKAMLPCCPRSKMAAISHQGLEN
jgi:hypothetical protein